MKFLFSVLLVFVANSAWASGPMAAPPAATLQGEVLEVSPVDGYTYLRLKTQAGESWAAVSAAPVQKGQTVTVENLMLMRNFESKTLKRTFPTIYFGNLAGSGAQSMGQDFAKSHASIGKMGEVSAIKVAKASGPNAYTVQEVLTKAAKLNGKSVVIKAQVVKYNPAIMGKNWVHLRDGTGSEADGTNDLLVTSMQAVKPGDIVTVKGIVRTDKDFGAGYSYKVLVEDGTFQVQ